MKSPVLRLALAFGATPMTAASPEGYFELEFDVTLESGDSWRKAADTFASAVSGPVCVGRFIPPGPASVVTVARPHSSCLPRTLRRRSLSVRRLHNRTGLFSYPVRRRSAWNRLDLANLMISSGFAFVSFDARGLPYPAPYAVAEQAARDKRAGPWQFGDVQRPAIVLDQAADDGRMSP